jgi:hypothetical protein
LRAPEPEALIRHLAVHEAAHAVAAWALGGRVGEVRISTEEGGIGHAVVGPPPLRASAAVWWDPPRRKRAERIAHRRFVVAVMLAGVTAEELLDGRVLPQAEGEWEAAREQCGLGKQAEVLYARAGRRVRSLLQRHWAAVLALAALLESDHVLSWEVTSLLLEEHVAR